MYEYKHASVNNYCHSEVEVRKFFDSATTSNLVVDPLSHNVDLSSFHTRSSPNNKRISKVNSSLSYTIYALKCRNS